jgi:hypothetical protein
MGQSEGASNQLQKTRKLFEDQWFLTRWAMKRLHRPARMVDKFQRFSTLQRERLVWTRSVPLFAPGELPINKGFAAFF